MIKTDIIKKNEILLNDIKYNKIKLNTQLETFEKKLLECCQCENSLITLLFEHIVEEEDFFNLINSQFDVDSKELSNEALFKMVLANSRPHLTELISRLESKRLGTLTDEVIVYIIRHYQENNDKDSETYYKDMLYTKNFDYINYIANQNAHKFYIKDYEYEDLMQEAYFGFEQAIIDFNGFRKASFRHFVRLLIDIRYPSLLNASKSKRNGGVLNSSISLNKDWVHPSGGGIKTQEENLFKNFKNEGTRQFESPSESLEKKELYDFIIDISTEREREVLTLKLEGYEYEEIANFLNLTRKQVDNALYRLRSKAKKLTEKNIF